jgi:hypothetical protein
MSLIVGGCVVFLVGFVSLHSVLRSFAEPPKAPAPRRLGMALAGATAGLGSASTVVQTIRITPQSAAASPAPAASPSAPARRQSRPEPRGAWAMGAPPTWLATVDAAAGLGLPAEVDPAAPIADTIARPKVVGLAAVTALALPPRTLAQAPASDATQVAEVEDVPMPRARPKPPARSKPVRKRGRR